MADSSRVARLYSRSFSNVQRDWDRHSDDCLSLSNFWFGYSGGHTCLADIGNCDDCSTTFYVEGLLIFEQPVDFDVLLCECCARKRGMCSEITPHGLCLKESD